MAIRAPDGANNRIRIPAKLVLIVLYKCIICGHEALWNTNSMNLHIIHSITIIPPKIIVLPIEELMPHSMKVLS